MDINERQGQRLQGCALGFLAGYVDALGFVALAGLFTAHVTGNFILIGASLADVSHRSVLLKLLAFPAFVVGVAAARLLVVGIQGRGRDPLRPALLLELVLLAGFMACGMAAGPMPAGPGPFGIAAGLLGAAGMGVHSATSRLLLAHLAPTSMMTGNVTQIVIDLVDWLRGDPDPARPGRFAKFLWPLLAFAAGCIAAAFAYHRLGFAALVVPVLILLVLLACGTPAATARKQATAS